MFSSSADVRDGQRRKFTWAVNGDALPAMAADGVDADCVVGLEIGRQGDLQGADPPGVGGDFVSVALTGLP